MEGIRSTTTFAQANNGAIASNSHPNSPANEARAGFGSQAQAYTPQHDEDAVLVELSSKASSDDPAQESISSKNVVNQNRELEPTAIQSVATEKVESEEAEEQAEHESKEEELKRLKQRDREVRAHEQAHLNALGPYKTGGASFTFETGPDGRQYAVSGEVPVDLSEEEDPEQTIDKAQVIRRAANAPKDPSAQDRQVAGQAAQLEARARVELAQQQAEQSEAGSSTESVEKTVIVQGNSPVGYSDPTSENLPGSEQLQLPASEILDIFA